MQHILFKIYNRKFKWKIAKSYDDKSQTEILRNVDGIATKKLTPSDFRKLAECMDRAGVKIIRILNIGDELYLGIND